MPERSEEALRQSSAEAEASRRLTRIEAAAQDPGAPPIRGYVLASRLGSGSYGTVWKAWQERTGKWVALKVFSHRHGADWLLLQRELDRLIRLDRHPGVVSLLDADLAGETPFYAMDLMEGGSLARFVGPQRAASPEQVERWAEQVASALAYVHAKGIIHGDLKPANLLLDGEGRVRVADFGQSGLLGQAAGSVFDSAAPDRLAAARGRLEQDSLGRLRGDLQQNPERPGPPRPRA